MVYNFDKSTKLVFEDEKKLSYIQFGGLKDNDPTVNIRRGRLMPSG